MLVRTPAFSICATLEQSWSELKEAIRSASPDFYKEIKDIEFDDIDRLSQRHKLTIYKYFNRAKYRPVPFGAFCSVSLLNNDINKDAVQISRKQTLYKLLDWQTKKNIKFTFQDLLKANALIQANTTWYKAAGNIRFITAGQGNKFEMNDIPSDTNILFALEIASQGIAIQDLIYKLQIKLGGNAEALNFVEAFIHSGLVVTSLDANIIGEDYFTRIGHKLEENYLDYIIAQRSISGGSPKELLKQIPELIERLSMIEQQEQLTTDLERFRDLFKEKFDLEEVSLMVAIDPEIGVGYGKMESAASASTLIDSLLQSTKNNNKRKDTYKELFASAFEFEVPSCINLEAVLPLSEKRSSPKKMANSISCIFSISDDLLILDHIGGYSFNQIAGRFTIADKGILDFCRQQASLETEANAEVVFFDIGYLCEIHVDNVNRRSSIYDYELPILSYSTLPEFITLGELYIRMSGNEIVLFSRRLGKRVVPRMATAYNFERSSLPLLKFLCDYMHYGLKTEFLPQISGLLPGLRQYPRIQFRNIVLGRAQWTVSIDHIKDLTAERLKEHLKQRQAPRFIRIGQADQTLVLDLDNGQDYEFLFSLLRSKKEITVEEAILPERSLVTDEHGKPYMAQFVAALNHHENVYYKARPIWIDSKKEQGFFPPGSEWLYCEIYSHTNHANSILFKLNAFADEQRSTIDKWFFIRYNEPQDHLRVRFLLRKAEDAQALLTNLKALLEEVMQKRIVSDFQVKVYKREMERYGFAGIDRVEALFCFDTRYTLQILQLPDPLKYRLAIILLTGIISRLSLDSETVQNWLQKIRDGYNHEHGLKGEGFKQINQYTRDQHLLDDSLLDETQKRELQRISDQYFSVLKELEGIRVMPLLTDFFHMHINRLFSDHQRLHETVIYNIKEAVDRKTKADRKIQISANS